MSAAGNIALRNHPSAMLVGALVTVASSVAAITTAATEQPLVTAVRISDAHRVDGTLGLGEEICVVVEFNEPVIVAGAPTLKLSIGDAVREAAYRYSGQSAHQGFCHTVEARDLDSDGVSILADAIHVPAGASFRSVAGVDAALAIDDLVVRDDDRHRVDGGLDRAPVITDVDITSTPTHPGGAYREGDLVRVGVAFSKPVVVTGLPTLALTIGGAPRHAVADFGAGASDRLEFVYIVSAGDLDTNGVSVTEGALDVNAWDRPYEIRDAQGNQARLAFGMHAVADAAGHAVDARSPAVDKVIVESRPSRAQNGYLPDADIITVALIFDENIVIAPNGPPRVHPYVPLLFDGRGEEEERRAGLNPSAGGSHFLRFDYPVRPGDIDTDGLSIGPGLVSSGWTITDRAGNQAQIDFPRTQHPGQPVGFVPFRDECAACPWMIELPGGSLPRENGPVWIEPFAVARTEVTRAQFAAFVAATGHEVAPGCTMWRGTKLGWSNHPGVSWDSLPTNPSDDHPVTCITYDDAAAFADHLGKETGQSYALLSYDQWEFAARGGTTTQNPLAAEADAPCKHENVSDTSGNWRGHAGCTDGAKFTARVGQYEPNPFELHDILANVQEYVAGCAATGADGCNRRAAAGWNYTIAAGTSPIDMSKARFLFEDRPRSYVGFRVVRMPSTLAGSPRP